MEIGNTGTLTVREMREQLIEKDVLQFGVSIEEATRDWEETTPEWVTLWWWQEIGRFLVSE